MTVKNLDIDTGSLTLCVNRDQNKLITFSPKDVNFAQRFYELTDDFAKKQQGFMEKAEKLDSEMEFNEDGTPKNLDSIFELTKELDDYFKERLDYVFGKGTSETCFGDVNVMSVDNKGKRILENFLKGIAPHIKASREDSAKEHTAKYVKSKAKTGNAKK